MSNLEIDNLKSIINAQIREIEAKNREIERLKAQYEALERDAEITANDLIDYSRKFSRTNNENIRLKAIVEKQIEVIELMEKHIDELELPQ